MSWNQRTNLQGFSKTPECVEISRELDGKLTSLTSRQLEHNLGLHASATPLRLHT